MNSQKTVRIKLRTNDRKEEIIRENLKRQQEVVDKFSEYIPRFNDLSVGKTLNGSSGKGKNPKGGMYGKIKEIFPDSNGLYSHQITHSLGPHMIEQFKENRYQVPEFNLNTVYLADNSIKLDINKEKVQLPLLKSEDLTSFKMILGDRQKKLLNNYEICSYGRKLTEKNGNYEIQQPVEIETDIDYKPETFIGVDLGLNNIAVVVVVKNNSIEEVEFFDGSELLHTRRDIWEKEDELKKNRQLEKASKLRKQKQRHSEQENHRISKRIVEIASKYEKPIIQMENLKGIRKRLNEERKYRSDRRKINSWSFGQLRNFIEYKSHSKGIKTKTVNPKNTSKLCYECGKVVERPYEGNYEESYCSNCDKQRNADFNASVNIAKST